VVETDAAGALLSRATYAPYGARLGSSGDHGPGDTGHVEDRVTGLVYAQQRDYDPVIGRFLGPDPLAAGFADGGNFNRYGYANNNPYKFTDPDGRRSACGSLYMSSCKQTGGGDGSAQASASTAKAPGAMGGSRPTGRRQSDPIVPVAKKSNYPTNQSNGQELQAAAAVGPYNAYSAQRAANNGRASARAAGLPGDRNGPWDALRHCTAPCYVARELDIASAILLGDIHELWYPNAADETHMDMFNNRWGAEHSAAGSTCGDVCRSGLDAGQLVVLPESRWDRE
jgi:RHS repeat-associated protein